LTYVRKTSQIRVSIVLPVYNEEGSIAACLHAIYRQTVAPYEVLVVDNNSTDATVAIARSFPFVRIIREPMQGVVHARNAGFNAARGDVIGRIDADTILADNWIESVQRLFRYTKIDAASGSMSYYDMAHADFINRVDLSGRRYMARLLGRETVLQGSNMAMRRSAWLAVREDTCSSGGLHEDFDLSIHLTQHDFHVVFDERMHASIGFRQAESTWREFISYSLLSPRTYALHGLRRTEHYIYMIALIVIAAYGPLWLLHHGYDQERGKFRLRKVFEASMAMRRVNPATYVD